LIPAAASDQACPRTNGSRMKLVTSSRASVRAALKEAAESTIRSSALDPHFAQTTVPETRSSDSPRRLSRRTGGGPSPRGALRVLGGEPAAKLAAAPASCALVRLQRCDAERRNTGRREPCRGILAGTNLNGADLGGANLSGADLTGANLQDANLTDATLTGALAKGANLNGVVWSNTTCPDGTNSNTDGGTCSGHL
jgi:hypothetical protein